MALKGIRVVEMAGLAPAPFCGMILADFGATVVRIDRMGSNSTLDVLANGKQSMALNLKHPKSTEIIRRLCRNSDVIIEPFRKGVMEKLNLGPDVLLKDNPKLIYARLTGFGQDGYYSKRAGHDINYVSLTGLLSRFTRYGEKPTAPLNYAADFAGGGLICALGICMALLDRNKSNLGQVIDANMVDGTAYVGSWIYRSQKLPIWGAEPGKNVLDTGAHFYDTYETKDGKFMSVGPLEHQFYKKFIAGLGLTSNDIEQFDDSDESKQLIKKKFLEKTQTEWCEIFDSIDACVTPVLDLETADQHPHNAGKFERNEDGCLCPKPAPYLSRTPGESVSKKPSPYCGEHTLSILKELNYSEKEINKFEEDNVIEILNNRSKL